MTTPVVSVVVPVFNDDPTHLAETLESIEGQSVDERTVETIVVDDGSSRPDTLLLLNQLNSARRRVLTQANSGPAAARNAGISAASGTYILPLDADDLIGANFIEESVRLLEHSPETRFCYGSISCFGDSTEQKVPPPELRLSDFFLSNRIVCTGVYRRADWERLGGYDETMRNGFEDYEWWVRLLSSTDVARRLPSARFYYRIRGDSRSFHQPMEQVSLTRKSILRNNQSRLEDLLRAAWEHGDQQAGLLAAAQGEVAKWRDRTAVPRRLMRALRRG